jgi:PhnB protein
MTFYQSVLGGDLQISTFKQYESPDMPTPEGYEDKVMHSTLDNGTLTFMASDTPPGMNVTAGDNFSISLAGADEALLTKYFDGLSAGGNITMPLAPQVWGDKFGMLVDKFGIHWMVNISATPQKAM